MRLAASILALILLIPTIIFGQVLETVIQLPDTLGPLSGPYHLAWDDNPSHPRLYIGGEADSGGIIVAHAIKFSRLARIQTGPVGALSFNPLRRKLYVSGTLQTDSLKVVDAATNRVVGSVWVAGGTATLFYNSNNDRLYCAGRGSTSIAVVDCATDSLVRTIPVAGRARVFELDSQGNKLYAGTSAGALTVIDCSGDSVVATVPSVSSDTGAIVFNSTAGKVYSTCGDTLFVIDGRSDTLLSRLYFRDLAPHLACDPTRNRVYCARGFYWMSIDCHADTVMLAVWSSTPCALVCDVGRDKLVLSNHGGVAGIYQATTGQTLGVVKLSGTPAGWSPALDRLYCVPRRSDPERDEVVEWPCLTVLDPGGDSMVGFVPLTMSASSICLDTVHNRLYFMLSSVGNDYIGVVDCARHVVTSYFYAGLTTKAMCYNPNNDELYWTAYVNDSIGPAVVVFDCSSGSVRKVIPVDHGTKASRLHLGLNKLYMVISDPQGRDVVNVIDCDRDSITKRITLPEGTMMSWLLVPEENRLWYISMYHVIAMDCLGDSIVADVVGRFVRVGHMVCSREDRKIFTNSGQVIDMDNPAHVESIPGWGGARIIYVPNAHKVYAPGNYSSPQSGHSEFLVLDSRGDTVVATFTGPCMTSGMCLDHTGDYIYCAGYEDSMMMVVDTRVDSVVTMFRVSTYGGAYDPLVANRKTNRIYETPYVVDGLHFSGRGIPVIHDSLIVGLEETKTEARPPYTGTFLASGVAPLRVSCPSSLYDASGRRVAVLHPGLNDIRFLTPGVYFHRQTSDGKVSKITVVR